MVPEVAFFLLLFCKILFSFGQPKVDKMKEYQTAAIRLHNGCLVSTNDGKFILIFSALELIFYVMVIHNTVAALASLLSVRLMALFILLGFDTVLEFVIF